MVKEDSKRAKRYKMKTSLSTHRLLPSLLCLLQIVPEQMASTHPPLEHLESSTQMVHSIVLKCYGTAHSQDSPLMLKQL